MNRMEMDFREGLGLDRLAAIASPLLAGFAA